MRGSWEDFTAKYGFRDGDGSDFSDYEARQNLVRLLNNQPEMQAAKITACEFDRCGIHNSCIILVLPNPDGKKPKDLIAEWELPSEPIKEVPLPEMEADINELITEAYELNKLWTYVVAEMYGGSLQDVHVYQDEDQERCEIAAKALARVLLPDARHDSEIHEDYDSSQCDSEVYVDLVPDVLHADDAYLPKGSTRVLSLAN